MTQPELPPAPAVSVSTMIGQLVGHVLLLGERIGSIEAKADAANTAIETKIDSANEKLDQTNAHLTRLNGKVAEHERKWVQLELDGAKELARLAGRAELRAEDKARAGLVYDVIGKDIVKIALGAVGSMTGYFLLKGLGYL